MNYDLTTRQHLSLEDGVDGGTVYNISSDQLVPAYTLFTNKPSIFNLGFYNLSDYISIVYQQATYNSSDIETPTKITWYNSTLCKNVIDIP